MRYTWPASCSSGSIWLADSAWLPTNLLPSPQLDWEAIDDHSARLTFTDHNHSAVLLVRFNERDEIEECEALRYFGDATQLPWVGSFAQYRRQQGVLVPFEGEASWIVDGQRQPYAHFTVQELSFEPLRPFNSGRRIR